MIYGYIEFQGDDDKEVVDKWWKWEEANPEWAKSAQKKIMTRRGRRVLAVVYTKRK